MYVFSEIIKFVEGKRLTYVQNLSCQMYINLYSVETNYFYSKSVLARYARCIIYLSPKICHARYLAFNLCHSRGFVHHGNVTNKKKVNCFIQMFIKHLQTCGRKTVQARYPVTCILSIKIAYIHNLPLQKIIT